MTQLSTGALWSSFRVILELENRSQQIDAAVSALKHAISDPESMSLPETVGLTDELRWHLDKSLKQLDDFERSMGVQRRGTGQREPRRPRSRAATYSLRGSTRSVCLPDLVGLLSAQRKTGTLWIKGKRERFILEFLDGAVVHAMCDSPRPNQRLGTVLVAQNKLSTEKLEEFLSQYCPQDGKIGEVMTRARLVSEDDLRDALEWQVRELFHRISSLEDAVFCFREGAISKLEQRVCLNTTQLLLESAQARDEQAWEEEQARGLVPAGDTDVGALEDQDRHEIDQTADTLADSGSTGEEVGKSDAETAAATAETDTMATADDESTPAAATDSPDPAADLTAAEPATGTETDDAAARAPESAHLEVESADPDPTGCQDATAPQDGDDPETRD